MAFDWVRDRASGKVHRQSETLDSLADRAIILENDLANLCHVLLNA
ncbi:MAG: hypothetical protein RI580_09880 [Halothece sp. Uz-M2-17]|nr:hypothetical protein [Halothece sp. Uz-M2-17]